MEESARKPGRSAGLGSTRCERLHLLRAGQDKVRPRFDFDAGDLRECSTCGITKLVIRAHKNWRKPFGGIKGE